MIKNTRGEKNRVKGKQVGNFSKQTTHSIM
jgi:hypothetical protein